MSEKTNDQLLEDLKQVKQVVMEEAKELLRLSDIELLRAVIPSIRRVCAYCSIVVALEDRWPMMKPLIDDHAFMYRELLKALAATSGVVEDAGE